MGGPCYDFHALLNPLSHLSDFSDFMLLNRPAADAAAPVEVDKDDEEGVEVEENDYEDDEEDKDEEYEERDEVFDDDDEDAEEDEVDAPFGTDLGCFGVLWGSFGHPLGTLWGRLGCLWGSLGLPWRSLEGLEGSLGVSGEVRGVSLRFLVAFGAVSGTIFEPCWLYFGFFSMGKSAFVFGSLLDPF